MSSPSIAPAGSPATRVSDLMLDIRQLDERTALYQALVGVLRERYLPRDSGQAIASIAVRPDGGRVSRDVIEQVASEIDALARDARLQRMTLARTIIAAQTAVAPTPTPSAKGEGKVGEAKGGSAADTDTDTDTSDPPAAASDER